MFHLNLRHIYKNNNSFLVFICIFAADKEFLNQQVSRISG